MPASLIIEKLKALYRLQDTLPKLIEDASVPTQKLDEYYVKLNMIVNEGSDGNKYPVEVAQIFSSITSIGKFSPNKVLIVGGAGVGKSAFIQNIAYKWGNGDILNDEFNYILKIRLKLLSTDWKDEYDKKEIRENPLKCFIDYSLRQEIKPEATEEEDLIKTEEIFEIFASATQDEILLLLDGFDEIAHLINKPGIVKTIVDKIFTFKYVMMTSRPNALNSQMENKFDRKIESIGLDSTGVQEYIKKYFTNQAENLIKKVEAFSFPFNQDEEIKNILLEEFASKSESQEYEAYIQLNKIEEYQDSGLGESLDEIKQSIITYYKNSQELVQKLIEKNLNVRELVETPINIAMLCLICSDRETIEKFQGDFNIGQLYQEVVFWLGKRYILKTQEGIDPLDITPEKISSLSELEALKVIAFDSLKNNQLVIKGSVIDQTSNKIKDKLGIRDINRYGLLKVDNHAKAKSANDLINQEHAFVHLSFQEYLTAYNLKTLLSSDDAVIFKQAAQFIAEHRNEPRYLLAIKFLAGLVTNTQSPNSENLISRFWESVICNVDGVLELGLKTKITLLMHLLEQSKIHGIIDARIPFREKLGQLIDTVIINDVANFAEQIEITGYTSPLIKEAIFSILDFNCQSKIEKEDITTLQIAIKIAPKLVQDNMDLQDLYKKLIKIMDHADWKVKLTAFHVMDELIKSPLAEQYLDMQFAKNIIDTIINSVTDETFKNKTIDLIQSIRKKIIDSDKLMIDGWIIKRLTIQYSIFSGETIVRELLKNINEDSIHQLGTILKKMPCLINQAVIDKMLIFADDYNSVADVLCVIVRQNSITSNKLLINPLLEKLILGEYDLYVRLSVLTEILNVHSSLLNQAIINKLMEIFECPSRWGGEVFAEEILRKTAINGLTIIADIDPLLINSDTLITLLKNQDFSTQMISIKAVEMISNTNPTLINQDVVNILLAFLNNQDVHLDDATQIKRIWIRKAAQDVLAIIAGKNPALIDQDMADKLVNDLKETGNRDALATLAKQNPGLMDEDIVNIFLDHLASCYPSDREIVVAIKFLNDIANNNPALVNQEVVNQLLRYKDFEGLAVIALNTIMEKKPNLINQLIEDQLITYSSNKNFDDHNDENDISAKKIKKLIKLLNSDDPRERMDAANSLSMIADNTPYLISLDKILKEMGYIDSEKFEITIKINECIENFSDWDSDIRECSVNSLVKMANSNFAFFDVDTLMNKFDDYCPDVREAVTDTIALIKNEKLHAVIIEGMADLLDEDRISRHTINTIGLIADKIPNLITQAIADQLWKLMADEYLEDSLENTITTIIEKCPMLVTTEKLLGFLNNSRISIEKRMVILDKMVIKHAALINQAVVDTVVDTLLEVGNNYKAKAVEASLNLIIINNPMFITDAIVDSLFKHLNNANDYYGDEIKNSALIAIETIVIAHNDITYLNQLLQKIKTYNFDLIRDIFNIVTVVTNQHSQLINKGTMDQLLENLVMTSNSKIKKLIIDTINAVTIVRPDLNDFDERLSEDDAKAINAIKMIVDEGFVLVNQEIVYLLLKKIDSDDVVLFEATEKAMISIVSKHPDLLDESVIDLLLENMRKDNSDIIIKFSINAIGEISNKRSDLLDQNAVYTLLTKIENKNLSVVSAVCHAIESIVQSCPDYFNQDIIDFLFEHMSTQPNKTKAIARAIWSIADKCPEVSIEKIFQEIDLVLMSDDRIKLSFKTEEEEEKEKRKREKEDGIIHSMLIMVDFFPALVNKNMLDQLVSAPRRAYSSVQAIEKIVNNRPDLIDNSVLSKLMSKRNHYYRFCVDVFYDAVMFSIADRCPDLVDGNLVEMLIPIVANRHDYIGVIVKLVDKRPELIHFDAWLKYSTEYQYREMAMAAIKIMVDKHIELINIKQLVRMLSDDFSSYYDKDAAGIVSVFTAIAEIHSELITLDMIDVIKKIENQCSSHSFADTRTGFFIMVAKKRIELIDSTIASILMCNIGFCWNGTPRTIDVMLTIARQRPNLIDLDRVIRILSCSDRQYSADLDVDFSERSRLDAAKILNVIIGTQPDLINLDLLVENFNNNADVKQCAISVFELISKKNLVTKSFLDKLINKQTKDSDYKSARKNILASLNNNQLKLIDIHQLIENFDHLGKVSLSNFEDIVIANIGSIDESIVDKLTKNFHKNDLYIQALTVIVEKNVSLINQAAVDKITKNLHKSDFYIHAINAIASALLAGINGENTPEDEEGNAIIDSANSETVLNDSRHYDLSLMSQPVVDALIKNSGKSDVCIEAIQAIAKINRHLINHSVVEKLLENLDKKGRQGKQEDKAQNMGGDDEEDYEEDQYENENRYSDTLNVYMQTINTISEANPELMTEHDFERLILFVNDNDVSIDFRISAAKFVAEKNFSPAAIKLLNHPLSNIRKVACEGFIDQLSQNQDVDKILSIIAFHDKDDVEKKNLIEAAKNALSQKEYKNIDIKWLSENYNYLMSLSNETFSYFRKIYHYILSDGKITEIEKNFIIKLLETGVSTSFTSSGGIILDGFAYVLQNEESKTYLKDIIVSVLQKKNDILIKQYNDYQPMFVNLEAGIKKAATDIKNQTSLIDKKIYLNRTQWLVSVMHLSDYRYSAAKEFFVFLERRNEFGQYEVHKTFFAQENIRYFTAVVHPNDIDRSLKEKIFGTMDYVESKPRYFYTSSVINLTDGYQVLNKLYAIRKGDISPESLKQLLSEITHDLSHSKLISEWSIYSQKVTMLTKYQLLDPSEEEKIRIRQDSVRIEKHDEMHHLKSKVGDLELRVDDIENVLKNIHINELEALISKEKLAQAEQQEITLIEADPYKLAFYQGLRWQLNSVYLASSAISSQMVENQSQGAMGVIGGFLEGISSHTPLIGIGVSILAQVLQGIDQSNQSERVDYYAKLVSDSSEMAKLAEIIARKIAIANLDFTFKESKLAQVIELTNNLDSLTGGALSNAALAASRAKISTNLAVTANNMLASGAKTVVDNAQDILQTGIAGIVAASYSNIKERFNAIQEQTAAGDKPKGLMDYAQRFIQRPSNDPNDPQVMGESDADTVAQLIIEMIFTGTFSGSVNEIKENILETLMQAYPVKAENAEGSCQSIPVKMKSIPSPKKKSSKTKIYSEELILKDNEAIVKESKSGCVASYAIHFEYVNHILNHPELLQEAYHVGGISAVNSLIEFGHDSELAIMITDAVELYGAKYVFHTFFSTKMEERSSQPGMKVKF